MPTRAYKRAGSRTYSLVKGTGNYKRTRSTKIGAKNSFPPSLGVGNGVFRPLWNSFGTTGFEVQSRTRKATLRYAEEIDLDANAGSYDSYTFSANGLFDPNITGTGHQPKGFDQLMTLYGRFYVTRSRIKVTPKFLGSAGNPSWMAIVLSDSTSLTNINSLTELSESSFRSRMFASGAQTTTAGGDVMTLGCDIKQYAGSNPATDSLFQGSVANNPNKQLFYNIVQVAVGEVDVVDPAQRYLLVEIEYDAVFFEPRSFIVS